MDGYYEFPPHIEPKARDLIKSFLCADRSLRLGFAKVRCLQTVTELFRTEQKKLRHTNGSGELTSRWYKTDVYLLLGYQKSGIWLILSTLTDMQNPKKVTPCPTKSNRNTSLIFEQYNILFSSN